MGTEWPLTVTLTRDLDHELALGFWEAFFRLVLGSLLGGAQAFLVLCVCGGQAGGAALAPGHVQGAAREVKQRFCTEQCALSGLADHSGLGVSFSDAQGIRPTCCLGVAPGSAKLAPGYYTQGQRITPVLCPGLVNMSHTH